jgi:flagellar hook protein FlgE
MSFYTSLSGLQAAQTDLSTISHNLANVSTNGFKKSRSEFADVMASNFTSDPRRLIGSGVALKENRQLFGEGNLQTTGNSLDLAVSGDGFFAVKTPTTLGNVAYTRNGNFSIGSGRFIVDAQGSRLQGYAVETDGTIASPPTVGDIKVPASHGEPAATENVTLQMQLNTAADKPKVATFNRAQADSYNTSTSTTIVDEKGNPTTLTNYFVRTDEKATDATSTSKASNWAVYSFVGDQKLNDGTPTDVTFDADGNMTAPAGSFNLNFPAVAGAAAGTTPRIVKLDISGTSAAKQPFGVVARTQDGRSAGEFSGIAVDDTGVISASYSNGDIVKIGKVALNNFVNPTGLRQTGNSYWSATGLSGIPTVGGANENGFGRMMSGTIEGSNVDITEELVNLIAAQRNFQANSKALDTASQISQTIFNIRA